MDKDTHIRIKFETLRAIRMYGGEIQSVSGDSMTDNDIIWHFFQSHRADIIQRASSQDDTPPHSAQVISE